MHAGDTEIPWKLRDAHVGWVVSADDLLKQQQQHLWRRRQRRQRHWVHRRQRHPQERRHQLQRLEMIISEIICVDIIWKMKLFKEHP